MRIIRTTITILLLLTVNTIFATVLEHNAATPTTATEIQLTDFTVRDYQKMMGKKMSLREKIVFYYAKSSLLKQSKKTDRASLEKAVADTGSGFNFGGFLLGFFLSIFGVLIALLFGKNVLRWAWRGFLVSLVIGIIAIVLVVVKE